MACFFQALFEFTERTIHYRWWMDGKFPQPVRLHGTTLAWHSNVIHDWINQNLKMSVGGGVN